MLILGSRLKDTAVMSLQTGTRLARINAPIIDPNNLKIIAYQVDGPLLTEHPSFLLTDDIREMGNLGMIIDSSEELIGISDVIKIEKLLRIAFQVIGKPVIDEHKHKLGKVEDYTVETGSFVIQQLNVKRGLIKGINDTGLLIHRSQITEINNKAIIVKSTRKKSAEPVMEPVKHEYVNPFRGANVPQPEQSNV
ncbi:MAG: hypothetical protein ABIP50_01435 [Candidatus Saccharimonadales bacterium]